MQNHLWNKQVCPKFVNLIIENNLLHRSGAKSMLCKFCDKFICVIVAHFYSYLSFLFRRDMMSIHNFNVFIHIFLLTWNKIRKFWHHVTRWSRIQNPIGQLRTVTKISTRTFIITRHMCHRCIYILVTVIFSFVTCTITSFIKTYLLLLFVIFFWWLRIFCN